MTENTIKQNSFNGIKFKGCFKAIRKRFMPKIVSRRIILKDAVKGHFKSSLTVYIPKLRPNYIKPCVMFHVSNGASSCLVRVKEPLELIKALEEILTSLRSDRWIDAWERALDISDELIVSERLIDDEEIIDLDAFMDELSTRVDVGKIEIKEELGGEK
jgi:hypothetical protein